MYPTQPSNQLLGREFVSDGSYARFVNVDGDWHMSLAPALAEHVRVGTTVTCDVETKAGERHTRSGTVLRTQTLPNGIRRALCSIEAFRAGRANDERNTFAKLPDGNWGVRLHVSASRRAHVGVRITGIVENEHGDRQAVGEIVSRDSEFRREPVFQPDDGVTEPCPACGTTACDAGLVGYCRITPEHHPERDPDDLPLADTPREEFGEASDESRRTVDDGRNHYARLPGGAWGVRIHGHQGRAARVGEVLEVAVTARSGRISRQRARVLRLAEDDRGDRHAIAEIVDRRSAERT